MCYYTAHNFSGEDIYQLEHDYVVKWVEPEFEPFFMANGFAHPKLPVITAEGEFKPLSWGLIASWVKDWNDAGIKRKGTLDARFETLHSLPSYRGPVKNGQFCIIPVKGFFEWHHLGKEKYPFFIYPKDRTVFHVAGLYENWMDKETRETHQTFTMVLTEPNERMALVHNSKRAMPAILSRENAKLWLDKNIAYEEKKKLLVPYDQELMADHPISKLITSKTANANSPQVSEPCEYPELVLSGVL